MQPADSIANSGPFKGKPIQAHFSFKIQNTMIHGHISYLGGKETVLIEPNNLSLTIFSPFRVIREFSFQR